jgi:lipopolysaccharide transport system ATP-binding protein
VVGVIGRNGAGKSTLLKIISRITEPTTGRVELYGRVGSLLEVGTGFHPELTGRENIYLNGALLGMTRAEIQRKFDEMVDFAEIAAFLDTPVKRYSSGMYVRLAFAVAAHLEPEILIVDEVLAVGDAAFQRKCLGKMGEVAGQGRTVLFVSHQMAAVQALCTRGILLRQGCVASDGPVSEVIAGYLQQLEQEGSTDLSARTERKGRGRARLTRVEIFRNDKGHSSSALMTGYPARFVFHCDRLLPKLACTFTIYDAYGQAVTTFNSALHGPEDTCGDQQPAQMICDIEELPLIAGRYRINAALQCNDELEDHVEGAAYFDVEQGHLRGRPVPASNRYGDVVLPHRWTLPEKD